MILGHERQLQYLEKALKNGRMSHAYLLYGPEGVGKFAVAKYLAGKLNCSRPIVLDTENTLVSKKEKRKDIPIEDIRELKRLFSLSAAGDEWRVAIINEAEKLSPEAADAFLKLFEEPGEKTLFLLVTSAPDLIPPTISSRAQQIRFSEVSNDVLSKFLAGKDMDGVYKKEILFFAAGRPGIIMRALEDQEYLNAQKKLLRSVYDILSGKDLPRALALAEKMAPDDAGRRKVVEYIVRMVRQDLLKRAASGVAVHSKVLRNILRIGEIMNTANVNPRLAMDTIFIEALGPDFIKA